MILWVVTVALKSAEAVDAIWFRPRAMEPVNPERVNEVLTMSMRTVALVILYVVVSV